MRPKTGRWVHPHAGDEDEDDVSRSTHGMEATTGRGGRGGARGGGRGGRNSSGGRRLSAVKDSDFANKPLRKVIVRNLPCGLTREAFEETLTRDGFDLTSMFDWCDYARGKRRGRSGGRGVGAASAASRSRWCGAAKTADTARKLLEKYGGARFRVRERNAEGEPIDGEGAVEETRAIVEFAPSQWTPKEFGERFASAADGEGRKNELEGTIEEDEDYLAFVAAMDEPKSAVPVSRAVTPKTESAPRRVSALLQYVWKKRANEQRAAAASAGMAKLSTSKSSKKKAMSKASVEARDKKQKTSGKQKKSAAQKEAKKPDAPHAKAKPPKPKPNPPQNGGGGASHASNPAPKKKKVILSKKNKAPTPKNVD